MKPQIHNSYSKSFFAYVLGAFKGGIYVCTLLTTIISSALTLDEVKFTFNKIWLGAEGITAPSPDITLVKTVSYNVVDSQGLLTTLGLDTSGGEEFCLTRNDNTGDYVFRDTNGYTLLQVACIGTFNQWLASELSGIPQSPLLLPSHIELRFIPYDTPPIRLFSATTTTSPIVFTNFCFTNILLSQTIPNIIFGVNVPTSMVNTTAIDLFCATELSARSWEWICRWPVPETWPSNTAFEVELSSQTVLPDKINYWHRVFDPLDSWVEYQLITNALALSPQQIPDPETWNATVALMQSSPCIATNTVVHNGPTNAAFFQLGSLDDTDGDGLTDAYEILSSNTDPANTDTDGDGIDDAVELYCGLDPTNTDTDGDGLPDNIELGGTYRVLHESEIPYLNDANSSFQSLLEPGVTYDDESIDAAPSCKFIDGYYLNRICVNVNGIVGLSSIYNNAEYNVRTNNRDLVSLIADNFITIAAYWDDLVVNPTNNADIGLVHYRRDLYTGIEFRNVSLKSNPESLATFQILFSDSEPTRVYVRYKSLNSAFNASTATIGIQIPYWGSITFPHSETNAIHEGDVIVYDLPYSDPLISDTDHDGIPDGEEFAEYLNPWSPDSDLGGISDKWELDNGSYPFNTLDTDYDHDGYTFAQEYFNGTDPTTADAPPIENLKTFNINIFGDYASWEMQINGTTPRDPRTVRVRMPDVASSESREISLVRGGTYDISMVWQHGRRDNDNGWWYCWQALINNLPDGHTYNSYSNTRQDGNEFICGDDWYVDNRDGLFTLHSDQCTERYGNVVESLRARLYILYSNLKLLDGAENAVLIVDNHDSDGDTVPDFADGYEYHSDNDIFEESSNTIFAPLTLEIPDQPDIENITVQFEYSASDPSLLHSTSAGLEPDDNGYFRIWKKDGSQPRTISDYIQPGDTICAADLDIDESSTTATLYLEAVKATSGTIPQEITAIVTVVVPEADWSCTLTNSVTARAIDLQIDSVVRDLEDGFEEEGLAIVPVSHPVPRSKLSIDAIDYIEASDTLDITFTGWYNDPLAEYSQNNGQISPAIVKQGNATIFPIYPSITSITDDIFRVCSTTTIFSRVASIPAPQVGPVVFSLQTSWNEVGNQGFATTALFAEELIETVLSTNITQLAIVVTNEIGTVSTNYCDEVVTRVFQTIDLPIDSNDIGNIQPVCFKIKTSWSSSEVTNAITSLDLFIRLNENNVQIGESDGELYIFENSAIWTTLPLSINEGDFEFEFYGTNLGTKAEEVVYLVDPDDESIFDSNDFADEEHDYSEEGDTDEEYDNGEEGDENGDLSPQLFSSTSEYTLESNDWDVRDAWIVLEILGESTSRFKPYIESNIDIIKGHTGWFKSFEVKEGNFANGYNYQLVLDENIDNVASAGTALANALQYIAGSYKTHSLRGEIYSTILQAFDYDSDAPAVYQEFMTSGLTQLKQQVTMLRTVLESGISIISSPTGFIIDLGDVADSIGEHRYWDAAKIGAFACLGVIGDLKNVTHFRNASRVLDVSGEVADAVERAGRAKGRIERMRILAPHIRNKKLSSDQVRKLYDIGFLRNGRSASGKKLLNYLQRNGSGLSGNYVKGLTEIHHDFPVKLEVNALQLGIDPDELCRILEKKTHKALHSGKGTGTGGIWIYQWERFLNNEHPHFKIKSPHPQEAIDGFLEELRHIDLNNPKWPFPLSK